MSATDVIGLWAPSIAMRRCRIDTARAFGATAGQLLGPNPTRTVSRARFAAAWVLKARWPQFNLTQIAFLTGVEDHSTAHYALKRAADLRATDMVFHYLTETLAKGLPVPTADPLPPVRCVVPLMNAADLDESDESDGEQQFGGIALGSFLLLKAIRREHPERMAA